MNIGRRLSDLERALGDDARCPRCNPRPGGVLDTRLVSGTCPACGRAVDRSGRSWRAATLIIVDDDGDLPEPVRRCCAGGVKMLHAADECLLDSRRG
jgi:hypothetical protein